jgi:TatD DNase family protein
MMIDTHCHLAAEQIQPDLDDVLARAWEAGVACLVAIGESRGSAEKARALATTDKRIWLTAGIHPHDASGWNPDSAEWLEGFLAGPRVVAAGEMGLDYHYDHSPRAAQRVAFEEQLALATRLSMPAVIHAREADADVAAILRNQPTCTSVLHSFSSGPILLNAGLELGSYVSFSGMITFRNWQRNDAIEAVPLDRILLETDAPYLAPTPYRGRRNEPAHVRRVAEQIAQVRGLPVEEVIALTGQNAANVFRFGSNHIDRSRRNP